MAIGTRFTAHSNLFLFTGKRKKYFAFYVILGLHPFLSWGETTVYQNLCLFLPH